jgi:hypothetical protein
MRNGKIIGTNEMIEVKTIDLAQHGVTLPSDRVGMVIAQPYLTLTSDEPYRCTVAAKAGQMDVLRKTLAVARAAQHGASKTHFTIFPEYSVPGLDGITLIDMSLNAEDWPPGTIVIGGTDALSREDFGTLTGSPNTHLDTERNGLDRIATGEWINCGITWVKGEDGTVERWLQPKLSRAWPEQNVSYQDMFLGKSVFTFKGSLEDGTQYRFSTLVCFDWIATIGRQKAWRWVVDGLRQQAAQAGAEQISLSWFFVIQCNRKPSDDTFLNEVSGFFDQTAFPTVRRERACIIFANSAGKDAPGRCDLFGCTSLIFSGQTLFSEPKCHPTFSNGGARFRSSTLLSAHRDVLFRERGACIHSFSQVNPNSLSPGAAGKTIALERAFVFPLTVASDPRAPSAAVPACVKWLNDELDTLPSLSTQYPAVALLTEAVALHQESIAALRAIPAQTATQVVKLAAASSQAKHADEWDRIEADALEHLVHTLTIVGLGFQNPTVGSEPAHATIIMNHQVVDLLAIRGDTHEACVEHSKSFLPFPRRQTLLVSRDRDNNAWRDNFGSFLEKKSQQLGQERRITEPLGGFLHLGYRRLLDIFLNSPTSVTVQAEINAELIA